VEEDGKHRGRCIHCSKKLVTDPGQGEQASIPFLNGNDQQPIGHELAITNDMSSFIATSNADADGCTSNIINNNSWSNMNKSGSAVFL
ncbi:unnamed protein product, partial [Cochlearia groenlandica]